MKEKVDSPSFYVFTDNPAWVKENLSWLEINWLMEILAQDGVAIATCN